MMDGWRGDLKNKILATGVGSLPGQDARAAVERVFDAMGQHIPFWPQLPKSSFLENMVVQFSDGMPGLKINEAARKVWVQTDDALYTQELEECFHACQAQDVEHFAVSPAAAEGLRATAQQLKARHWKGWVKAQIIGPISLGLTLCDEKKSPVLFNAELRELLPSVLALKAAWVIDQLLVSSEIQPIVFVDEPYLVAVGTSGCAMPRETIIGMINGVIDAIHAKGAAAGIHCCGNTDWDLVMATKIDILNFDAHGYFDKLLLYERALSAFLARGGLLAAGIVPTNEELKRPDASERLFASLKRHAEYFRRGGLITSSCGLSGLSPELAGRALGLCVELAERMRREFQ